MTATCPACAAPQDAGLLCHSCTSLLERDLGDVASIVADLDIALSKQARIGNAGGGGLARERSPISIGAMQAADTLTNVLTTWARDVCGGRRWLAHANLPAVAGANYLLAEIPAIRRHPAVDELADQIHDAISQARRAVDRPADRIYLGQCEFEQDVEGGGTVTCYEELYASPGASEVRCRVCGITHPVHERRAWLMTRAEDMLFTPREASEMLGEIGHINVSQASIRGYIHRGKIAFRAPIEAKRFRLGDLLAVIMDDSERKTA